MTSVGATGGGQVEPYVFTGPDTSKLDRLDSALQGHVEQVQGSFGERMTDLKAQIADCEDRGEKMALQGELRSLERELGEFHSAIEDIPSHALSFSGFAGEITDQLEAAIDDFHDRISASYTEFGTVDQPVDTEMRVPSDDRLENLEANSNFVGEGEGTGSVDEGSEGVSDADGSEGGMDELPEMEEMVNMLANDPDAFMDELSELAPEDRNAAMMAVQTQLQQLNQLFQMTSQFSQSMHDTQKAIIQNLRV